MLRAKSNNSKQNNSNYQSLYLWASFLLGMISLGIVIWNRGKTSSVAIVNHNVIPAQAGIHSSFLDVEFRDFRSLIGVEDKPQGNTRRISQKLPAFTQDESYVSTCQMNFPSFASLLALSAFDYQQSGSAISGLIMGLHFYISQARTQVIATFDLNNLKITEGIIFSGVGPYTGSSVYAADINKMEI